jgi:hypothetical protein
VRRDAGLRETPTAQPAGYRLGPALKHVRGKAALPGQAPVRGARPVTG